MAGFPASRPKKGMAGLLTLLTLSLLLAACDVKPPPTGSQVPVQATTPSQITRPPKGAGFITGPYPREARQLTGAGATFPAPLYSKWFSDYQRLTNVSVNYQAIGSGGGIKSILDRTVDFGASDGPMSDEQLRQAASPILHIPTTLGAVIPVYNIPGLADPPLRFSPETLAGIFLGDITKWNDPKVAADNPGVSLPAKDIVVVHRSDGSGTTYIFVDYLNTVSDKWKNTVGRGTSVNWPVGLGGKGNEGVSGEVKANPYSLGYVELIYALQNKLGYGDVKNSAGKYVRPSIPAVTAAAASVAENIAPDLRASIVNAPGPDAYPIAGFTWLLVYQTQSDPAKAAAVTRLLWWGIHDGQQVSADLGYAPLPETIMKRAEDKILSVAINGEQALPVP